MLYCASQAIGAIASKASNKACAKPSSCFIAGTLVLTADGAKPIEDIAVGDQVWAYDEETGDKALKRVVRLFRNVSSFATSVEIQADDGTVNKLVSTPGHKYYLPFNEGCRDANEHLEHAGYVELSDKWVSAKDLKKGDKVVLASADSLTKEPKYGIVVSVKTEKCAEFTTYNFEVEDFHTYYVGENGVCVHNAGCDWKWGEGSFDSVDDSLIYHADKHAGKLKLDPSDTAGYLRKAQNFAETAVQRGVKPLPGFVEGATSNIRAYSYAGKVIWMDKANRIIINFFVPG